MNKSGKNRAINELETSNNPDTTEVGESNAEVLEYEGAAVEDIQLEDTEEIVTVDAEPPEKADVEIREGGDIEAAEEALTTSEKPEADLQRADTRPILPKQKFVLLMTIVALFAVAIALLTVAVTGMPRSGGVCRNISEMMRTGNEIGVVPDPVLINMCNFKKCKFDVQACSQFCPLGYVVDSDGCVSGCACNPKGLFQGDIQFSETDVPTVMKMFSRLEDSTVNNLTLNEINAIWNFAKLNNRYEIPYKVSTGLSNKTAAVVRSSLQAFSLHTCLDFVEATNQTQFIEIKNGEKCSATFGFKLSGNIVTLNEKYCAAVPVVQHLIMHILGFHHETSRPDRDNYIVIHTGAIQPGLQHAFSKLSWNTAVDLDVEYNTMSLMHFASTAFAVNEGMTTISGEVNRRVRGENVADFYQGMQDSDYLLVNRRYECPNYRLSTQWSEWSEWTMDNARFVCFRYRQCVNNANHNSVGCGPQNVERDDTQYNCRKSLTSNGTSPGGRSAVAGRVQHGGGMFTAPVSLDKYFCMLGTVLKGKFNADNRDDLMCLYDDGWMRIYLANTDGTFEQLDWEGQTKACMFGQARKMTGDMNGDGFSDLLCSYYSGTAQVLLFQEDQPFHNDYGHQSQIDSCKATDHVTLADVDGDGKDDFICGDDTNWFREVYLNIYQQTQ